MQRSSRWLRSLNRVRRVGCRDSSWKSVSSCQLSVESNDPRFDSHIRNFLTARREDLFCRPVSAGDGAMHGPVMPGYISGLTSKKQCVVNRIGESLLRFVSANPYVAVRAPGKRIALPVVPIGMRKQAL